MKKHRGLLIVTISLIVLFAIALSFRVPQRVYGRFFQKPDSGPLCTYELKNFKFHYQKETATPSIVMFGNSLIDYGDWKTILGREDVINRGIAGDQTYCMCERLQYLTSLNAKIWFIEGGINNIGMSPEGILGNYAEIVQFVKNENAVPVINLVLHIGKNAGNKFTAFKDYETVNSRVDALNKLLTGYAQENGINIIDLNPLLTDKEGLLKDEFTTDGVHLTDKAYKLWGNEIDKLLESHNIQQPSQ